MSLPWVKLHTCIISDPKVLRLDPEIRWYFVALVCAAGKIERAGMIGDDDDAAIMLHVSKPKLRAVLEKLGTKIVRDSDGILWVNDWSDWQSARRKPEPAEQVATRKRAERERARQLVTQDVTQPVTQSVTQAVTQPSRMRDVECHATQEIELRTKSSVPIGTGAASAAAPPADRPADKPKHRRSARPPKPDFAMEHPGAALYRQVIGRNASRAAYGELDAALAASGPETMEFLFHEWILRGFNPTNIAGMLDVLANGWRDTKTGRRTPLLAGANGTGRVLTGDGGTPESPMTAEERERRIAEVRAMVPASAMSPAHAAEVAADLAAGRIQ